MKNFIYSLCAVALLTLSGCDKYDDGPLSNRVENLENRVKSLEDQCKQLNTNVTSIQTLVNAMGNGDAITSVTPIKEGDKEVGYTFAFVKSPSISVYHGKDGNDGQSGQDGSAPVIGIKQDDKGNYCWTLNGEWLLDDKGNKIATNNTSTSNLPEFKIDKDNWLMSADGGKTWVNLGKGTADGKNTVFNDIDTSDPQKVTFTLSDGTKFILPFKAELAITLSEEKQVLVRPNTTMTINYTITGNTKDLYVEVITSGNIKAKIDNNEATSGTITIKVGESIDEYDKLILFATNGSVTVFKSLIFKVDEYVHVIDQEEPSFVAEEGGGAMDLNIETNTDYSVNIPDEAKEWISVVQSRAAQQATIKLNIKTNDGYTRCANIIITNNDGKILISIQIIQKGESIIPEDMTVAFPDENFRNYLLQNFDADNNGKISDVEALKVKRIVASHLNISSLEGIQFFTNLERLYCNDNKLSTLNVSKNTVLIQLDCELNKLTTLDLSENMRLKFLKCFNNELTTLNVSVFISQLECYNNLLGSLDVSKCSALYFLKCNDNQLTSLDVSGCTALKNLYCNNNQLTALNVSDCIALTQLSFDYNQLTSLDISKNIALTGLFCYNNKLTSLNVSNNTALSLLYCNTNQLVSLDVSKNTALTELYCPFNKLTSLDVSGCTALTNLYCVDNQLTSLDVSGCTALTGLTCGYNQLTTLDVANNTWLTVLACGSNQLTTLDVSRNTKLTYLECLMSTLNTLYLKTAQQIDGINVNRNKKIIDTNTEIKYID